MVAPRWLAGKAKPGRPPCPGGRPPVRLACDGRLPGWPAASGQARLAPGPPCRRGPLPSGLGRSRQPGELCPELPGASPNCPMLFHRARCCSNVPDAAPICPILPSFLRFCDTSGASGCTFATRAVVSHCHGSSLKYSEKSRPGGGFSGRQEANDNGRKRPRHKGHKGHEGNDRKDLHRGGRRGRRERPSCAG